MTSRQAVISFSIDSTSAVQGMQAIIANLREIQSELVGLNEGTAAAKLQILSKDFEKPFAAATKRIAQATKALEELRAAQQRVQAGLSAGIGRGSLAASTLKAQGTPRDLFAPTVGTGGVADQAKIKTAIQQTEVALASAKQKASEFVNTFRELGQLAPEAYQRIIAVQRVSLDLEEQLRAIRSGDVIKQATQRRLDGLLRVNAELQRQKVLIEENIRRQAPKGVQKDITRGLAETEKQADALTKVKALDTKILELAQEIAVARGKASEALFGEKSAEQSRALADVLEDLGGEARLGKTLPQEEKALELIRERSKQLDKAAVAGERADDAMSSDASLQRMAGARDLILEIDQRLNQVAISTKQALSPELIAQTFPGLSKEISLFEALNREITLLVKGTELWNQKQIELNQSMLKIQGILRTEGPGGTKSLSAGEQARGLEAQIPRLQSLLIGTFKDMSRRFAATLQFAISAALIFGVQRFVREFIQTAFEVERAFADIETAFSLDIDAGRGTLEFRRQVEDLRQDVLLIAQDLNVLPTEANKAAFQMVARFSDTGTALKALRAQLLATKVSTIDQAEVLRALTAVAEGFANEVLRGNLALSLQERLLRREEAAANLYGRALDVATQIQQEFGIEVEDTLEGMARATQVFSTLGFTLEETAALVAAVSLTLGQTGSQASEKLVRSLGDLTDPKIREALLDLSSTSETFALTIGDFESGATAWKKIVDQFARLEKIDPSAARELLNIIGQRRELEVVAAALGTGDLQESILTSMIRATGSAEKRFGFLEQTASETIKSISAGFQELAQNFERLGGLVSVKLFLKTLDEIVSFLNDALKILIDFIDLIDVFNIAPWVKGVLSLVASLAIALKIAIALRDTFVTLAASKIAVAATGSLKGFFGGAAAATLGGSLRSGLAGTAAGGGAAGLAAKGAIAASLGFKTLTGVLSSVKGPLIGIGLIAAVTAVSLKTLHDEVSALRNSFRDGIAGIEKATKRVEAQILEEGLVGAEADKLRRETVLAAVQAAQTAAPSASPAILSILGAAIKDSFLPTLISAPFVGDRRFELQNIGQRIAAPEEIEGSSELFQDIAIRIQAQIIQDATDALRGQIQKLRSAAPEVAGASDLVDALIPASFLGLVGIDTLGGFEDQAAEIEALIRDRSGGPEAILGRQIEADLLTAALAQDINETWAALGRLPAAIGRSVNIILDAVATLDERVLLGIITLEEKRIELEAAVGLLEGHAKEYDEGPDPAKADEVLASSLEIRTLAIKTISDQVELLVLIGTSGRTTRQQLLHEIALKTSQLETLRKKGLFDTPDFVKLNEEINGLFKDLNDDLKEEALQRKRTDLAQAVTLAQRRAATNALIVILRQQAAALDPSDPERARILADVWKLQFDIAETVADDLAKENAARIRLQGPINNEFNRIKAQIALAKDALRRATSPGEAAEAEVVLMEALAAEAFRELATISAMAAARAGARDSIASQAVVLKTLISEQRLTGRTVGVNTKAWHDLKTAIQQAQAQLFDMVLELESINRILGTDITNPLEQAEQAWIDANRALQVPDLGELEKQRAELNVRESAAALERSRFDVALFELGFLKDTDVINQSQYVAALRELLKQVDVNTFLGKNIWRQINDLILGMTEDISNMAFNIPGQIRLPTLFEIRRAVEADAMGVNYVDNRQIDVRVNVQTVAEMGDLLKALTSVLGDSIPVEGQRLATGNAGLTVGPF